MKKSEATCLSVSKGRRERLLEQLEEREVYARVRSDLTLTAMALQRWISPQPFPLIPVVRNPVLSLLGSPALCATLELLAHLSTSCSFVTASHANSS